MNGDALKGIGTLINIAIYGIPTLLGIIVILAALPFILKPDRYKALDAKIYQPCLDKGFTKKRCDLLALDSIINSAELLK